jgi:uncharacterized membrane protein YkvA (DUF1232 family)
MLETMKSAARSLRQELEVYALVSKDPRTPKKAKVLLGAAVGYALLPFDLIPDWIPVIGHLDDFLIVPGLVRIALRCIPADVVRECRQKVRDQHESPQHRGSHPVDHPREEVPEIGRKDCLF